jgi:hypothetical protein
LRCIRQAGDTYQINPEIRVECAGHFDESKCVEMSLIDSIVLIAA